MLFFRFFFFLLFLFLPGFFSGEALASKLGCGRRLRCISRSLAEEISRVSQMFTFVFGCACVVTLERLPAWLDSKISVKELQS